MSRFSSDSVFQRKLVPRLGALATYNYPTSADWKTNKQKIHSKLQATPRCSHTTAFLHLHPVSADSSDAQTHFNSPTSCKEWNTYNLIPFPLKCILLENLIGYFLHIPSSQINGILQQLSKHTQANLLCCGTGALPLVTRLRRLPAGLLTRLPNSYKQLNTNKLSLSHLPDQNLLWRKYSLQLPKVKSLIIVFREHDLDVSNMIREIYIKTSFS